jgi:hypothetical protein
MTSPYTTEPADKSGNDRPSRWQFQYSLRSLMLFFVFFALLLTSIVMYWRFSQFEQEIKKLRYIAGYLKIEDENQFYALALDSPEPWTWRWRVYLPAGYKYSWHIDSGNLPDISIPNNDGAISSDRAVRNKGIEATVDLSLRNNPEGVWYLYLTFQSAHEKRSLRAAVSDDVVNRILNVKIIRGRNIGEGKVFSSKIDQSSMIIFVKRRFAEKQPDGSWKNS